MEKSLFVGREKEFEILKRYFQQGSLSKGHIIFLEGDAGIGKSLFLEKFIEENRQAGIRFLEGSCYQETGPNSAYQPFIDILDSLSVGREREGRFWQLFSQVLKETAPDWLGIVPVLGPLLGASARTVTATSNLLTTSDAQSSKLESMVNQYTDAIIQLSEEEFIVAIIEDAHWIDDASCRLLKNLAPELNRSKILLVLTYRPSEIQSGHSLFSVRDEIISKGLGRIVYLEKLGIENVKKYLDIRYQNRIDSSLENWLYQICDGNPLFVTQYCNFLEQESVIRVGNDGYVLDGEIIETSNGFETSGLLARSPVPTGIESLLEKRMNGLIPEERLLLELASVQGEVFGSNVLSIVLIQKETEVLTRLRKLKERHRIIRLIQDELPDDLISEYYEFEHVLIHKVLYGKLSPREKILYHREIASVLSKEIEKTGDISRKEMIDVSYQYSMGQQPIESAKYSYLAAQSCFNDAAIVECRNLCRKTLSSLQLESADSGERDILFAKTALLLMSSITPKDKPGKLKLLALGNQALSAAERSNEKALCSGIKSRIGNLYIGLGNVPEALKFLKEAVDIAELSGDVMTLCSAMSRYGNDLAKINLKKSLEIRQRAYQIYKEEIQPNTLTQNTGVDFTISTLLISLGVGEFDDGSYSSAISHLREGIEILQNLRLHNTSDLIDPALNYISQVYIATGLYEEAESVLLSSIGFGQEKAFDPWRGNNLALLGKLYIEWERFEDAQPPMVAGVEESNSTQQIDLITIVRNYYAELLMNPSYSGFDLDEAENILLTNLGECQLSGMHRSVVVALSLLSRLALQRNMKAEALNYSLQAIAVIEEFGQLPAVRIEEVYFYHYFALQENEDERADTYLVLAYEVLMEKSKRISNKNDKLKFFSRVPLSKQIATHFLAR